MEFEEKERDILQHKKKVEHEQTVNSVFANVDSKTGKFGTVLKPAPAMFNAPLITRIWAYKFEFWYAICDATEPSKLIG